MTKKFPRSPTAWFGFTVAAAVLAIGLGQTRQTPDPFQPRDTQPEGEPLRASESRDRVRVPDGFRVTLAAAEPQVRQPIAICFDDRGRLWVAESYSYNGSDFTEEKHDRILIFADENGDGVFESRKIFHDRLNRLTGLVWGFGGVWVATAPTLSFIPDRNGDDQPDGDPIVHLDGWTLKAEHNSVNGLLWGPDGWLYGRHGMKSPSRPGRPGTPPDSRVELSCSIWRYHPTRHTVEVVVDGTVNPWGLDFDDFGQMFMTSSVVDHLWHVVPGSHLRRLPEILVHPHVYETMDPTNDHSHRPKGVVSGADGFASDDGGGGHSHVDAMFYLGGHWPETYRGGIFMNNIIGRRVNVDRFMRDPDTGRFVAKHGADFLRVDDPWFRGLSLEYGPDGDVILTDWSDLGECHDRDGVSRNSGRIYKISWGAPRRVPVELEKAGLDRLVALQSHRNDWFVRHSRRLLQERAAGGVDMTTARVELRRKFDSDSAVPHKLRAMWALHVIGGADRSWLETLLDHSDENIRYWAVRLLVDAGPPSFTVAENLIQRAGVEASWLARMALASSLSDMDAQSRWKLGQALASRTGSAEDPNLVRLIWSGWQPAVAEHPKESIDFIARLQSRRLRQWTARRMAEAAEKQPALADALLRVAAGGGSASVAVDVFQGMEAGLSPRTYPISPQMLASLQASYVLPDRNHRHAALLLGIKLGDTKSIETLRSELADAGQSPAERNRILKALVPARPTWLPDELLRLVEKRDLTEPAIRALAAFSEARIPDVLLAAWPKLEKSQRTAAVDTLIARPAFAHALLDAIVAGKVPKDDISQFQARQASELSDPELHRRFDDIWGSVNPSPQAVRNRITSLRMILKDQAFMATANLHAGRLLFEARCSACHTLFDKGGKLGPDLTGSGRKDLDYLLINVIDPNASILANWRLAVVTLADGRVISGTLTSEREGSIDMQTPDGVMTLERSSVRSLEKMQTSLMPTGLLDDQSAQQVRDLFAFLMSDTGAVGPRGDAR